MALTQQLRQKQTQSLKLTPQLRQAIKLLELSNLDLSQYIEQQLLDNPLLSLEGSESSSETAPEPSETSPEETSEPSESLEALENPDYDNMWTNDDIARDGKVASQRGDSAGTSQEGWDLDRLPAHSVTLRDHILSQLNTDLQSPIHRLIGVHLLDLLDETGYLSGDLAPLTQDLGCSMDQIEEILEFLQEFDPPGVFARNLKECMALQLKEIGLYTKKTAQFLEHLDLFAEGKIDEILKRCSLTSEELAQLIKTIRTLDPKPGLKFETSPTRTIIPDVFVKRDKEEGWILRLNDATLPKVLVDQGYMASANDTKKDKDLQKYLSERYAAANWLVKSLDQRARTILSVSKEIIKQQQAFLDHGIDHLKPLILKDIASAIEMHESTISRVTNNKYMSTPRGTFELKYFFSTSLGSIHDDGEHSSKTVQGRIKALVAEEPRDRPYSDDQLVKVLADEGIDVARRTITKYRESLDVPSSYQRKRNYKREQCA